MAATQHLGLLRDSGYRNGRSVGYNPEADGRAHPPGVSLALHPAGRPDGIAYPDRLSRPNAATPPRVLDPGDEWGRGVRRGPPWTFTQRRAVQLVLA